MLKGHPLALGIINANVQDTPDDINHFVEASSKIITWTRAHSDTLSREIIKKTNSFKGCLLFIKNDRIVEIKKL